MSRRDNHLRMTADDLRAARVLTLAVKFFGTRHPISSSSINIDLYPDLDDESFNRQYLRDRELLATFGIHIREAGSDGNDTCWQIDENSYVQGEGLGAQDARILYVLCHDMAYDQSFAYRDELRMALAKISQMYRGTTFPHTDETTPSQHKLLSVLVSCMGSQQGVRVTYTKADGDTITRDLALLGSFGLRGRTYFVASKVLHDGSLAPDSVRTYRLDRFEKARAIAGITYQVPLDFSVSDYERLPFQMGEFAGKAQFLVPVDIGREVTRAMSTHGTSTMRDDGSLLWEVIYSDAHAAASWAVGTGITAVAPQQLVEECESVCQTTCNACLYDGRLGGLAEAAPVSTRQNRAGRTGSVTVVRQLLALAGSLTNEGEVITADDIAGTLGISYDQARHLIALVSLGSGESIDYLPVIMSDEDDEVALMEGAGLSARRVRLTRSETIALSAALAELGVADDDPLVQTLKASYVAPSFSTQDIMRSLEAPSSATDGATLRLCSQAITDGKTLRFSYVPVAGGAMAWRHVVPRLVRRGDDSWYLDAYDLRRGADRVFRIDHMGEVSLEDAAPAPAPSAPNQKKRLVNLHFSDSRYLDLFHWEGLEVVSRDDGGTTARLPHYGGNWLTRHVAACAGTVTTDDSTLAEQAKAYASRVLAES